MSADYDFEAVDRIRRFLEDTTPADADLVDAAREAAYSATTAAKVADLYRSKVSDRMQAVGASMLIGNEGKAERMAGSNSYEWNAIDVQLLVCGALGEGEFIGDGYGTSEFIPAHWEVKCNTTKLKALAKKMGPDFEAQLMAAATITPGPTRIVYSEKRKQ